MVIVFSWTQCRFRSLAVAVLRQTARVCQRSRGFLVKLLQMSEVFYLQRLLLYWIRKIILGQLTTQPHVCHRTKFGIGSSSDHTVETAHMKIVGLWAPEISRVMV